MNLGVASVQSNRVVFFLMFLILAGGIWSYQNIGRLEDPEFTIKEALVITPYGGASAQEVCLCFMPFSSRSRNRRQTRCTSAPFAKSPKGPAVKGFRVANYPHNSDQVTTKRVDDLASNSYTRVKRPGVSPAPFDTNAAPSSSGFGGLV